jgi:hypothetical protein
MGSMSASDAAPLPRLGEVFFDVRGNSRSMRLSWYADTGVAVFSIWQGGTCTGTFRLPMDDLARMIESLRRGPRGQRGAREAPGADVAGREVPAGRGGPAQGAPGGPDAGQATVAMRLPSGPDAAAAPRREDRGEPGYPPGPETGPGPAYGRDPAGYPDPLSPGYPGEPAAAAYPGGPGGPGDFPPGGRGYPDVPVTGDYRRGGTGPRGYPDEPSGEYRRPGSSGGYPAEPGYPADPGYPDVPVTGDYRRPAPRRPDEAGYRDPGYPDGPATGDYRPGASGSHRRGDPGYPAAAEEYRRGTGGSHRREAGYPADPGYPAETPARYSRDPGRADYPDESGSGGSGGYPAVPDYHGDEWDEDTADQPAADYGAPPRPESHPYGRARANREPPERGRYPGRH